MLKSITLLLLAVCLTGCKPSPSAAPTVPKPLPPHRYPESVELDQATPSFWYWRPLPDSLNLEGFSGARYIARLPKLPEGTRYTHHLRRSAVTNNQRPPLQVSADEVRSGGGLSGPCDLVWDIFWKREGPGKIEFSERLKVIEEMDGHSQGVSNYSVINRTPLVLTDGEVDQGVQEESSSAIAIKMGEPSSPFSVVVDTSKRMGGQMVSGIRFDWYFICEKPH